MVFLFLDVTLIPLLLDIFLSPGFLFYFIYLFSFKESQIFVITKCYVDICRRCITHYVDTSAVQSEIAGSGIEDLIRQRQIVLICCSKEVTISSSFPIYFQSLVTESMSFIMWKALRIFFNLQIRTLIYMQRGGTTIQRILSFLQMWKLRPRESR